MKNADWALVISPGILWGMSFVFVELLLAYLSPFMIVYLRVAIGAFFLLPIFSSEKPPLTGRPKPFSRLSLWRF
jgi:drug/metabolite transporter (DMT)-like permease